LYKDCVAKPQIGSDSKRHAEVAQLYFTAVCPFGRTVLMFNRRTSPNAVVLSLLNIHAATNDAYWVHAYASCLEEQVLSLLQVAERIL